MNVLTKLWHSTNCVVVGGSPLTFIVTAMEAKNARLDFVGMVKLATEEYLKDFLKKVQLQCCSNFFGMTTKKWSGADDIHMM